MKRLIGGLAVAAMIVGIGGCASFSNYMANYPYIEDLERELEAKNYKPNFTHLYEPMAESSVFDRSSLIGRWECQVDVQSHTLCGDDIMSRMANKTWIEKRCFSFNADGTYSHDSSGQMCQFTSISHSHTGRWKYEKGELMLSQRTSTYGDRTVSDATEIRYRVVWHADGRVLITESDGERTITHGSGKSKTLTSTDRYGVQSQKITSVMLIDNGRERGLLTVFFRSPAVYSRVGGNVVVRTGASRTVSPDSVGYQIKEFERLKDKDYGYAFALALPRGANASNLREIGKKFSGEVKQNYIDTYHPPRPDELQVLLNWRLENGFLKGVASVITVVPTTLTYDANTRKGRVVVRAGVNQLSEARTWIDKNIKKIVCDKNVVLETGVRPTEDAHYSVTRETVKDRLFGEMWHGLWRHEVGVASQGGMTCLLFRSAA